jgi:hypothetical protein
MKLWVAFRSLIAAILQIVKRFSGPGAGPKFVWS